jgi:hypothetical protein
MMTKEVWSILMDTPPPHRGFEFQPIDRGDKLIIRVFVDNFSNFSVEQQEDLGDWITMKIISKVWELGIPCYLEVKPTKESVKN